MIKSACPDFSGNILRWEGAFAEAGRNHLSRLVLIFGTSDITGAGGMDSFSGLLQSFNRKYCPDTVLEPELTFMSSCDPREEAMRRKNTLLPVSSGQLTSAEKKASSRRKRSFPCTGKPNSTGWLSGCMSGRPAVRMIWNVPWIPSAWMKSITG